MYDVALFQEAMAVRGLNYYQISKKAKSLGFRLDPKTAKKVVTTGLAHPDCVFAVAKALGFKVKRDDLSAVVRRDRRKSA